jgi:hypothetical protein
MARYTIKNNDKKRNFGRVDPRVLSDPAANAEAKKKATLPFTWGDISIFLEPGKKMEIGGPVATGLVIPQLAQIAKNFDPPMDIEIKEIKDAGQTFAGQPIWVVVVDKDACYPEFYHDKEKAGKPIFDDEHKILRADACGTTWELEPGPNEMTEFCATGIIADRGFALKKDADGKFIAMPKEKYLERFYPPPRRQMNEDGEGDVLTVEDVMKQRRTPKDEREPFCEFAGLKMDSQITVEEFVEKWIAFKTPQPEGDSGEPTNDNGETEQTEPGKENEDGEGATTEGTSEEHTEE